MQMLPKERTKRTSKIFYLLVPGLKPSKETRCAPTLFVVKGLLFQVFHS